MNDRTLINTMDWQSYFGRRYLQINQFISWCQALYLYGCTEGELESYEEARLLFPAARIVMPLPYASEYWTTFHTNAQEIALDNSYIRFHQLQEALRYSTDPNDTPDIEPHIIDRSWEHIPEGLERPNEEQFRPWSDYEITVNIAGNQIPHPTAMHFYHYWQVYELYEVRRNQAPIRMYVDNAPVFRPSNLQEGRMRELASIFDAVSYFQWLYSRKAAQLNSGITPDEDGLIWHDIQQQTELETAASAYAQTTLGEFDLEEDTLYRGLQGMMSLHNDYETSERTRLARAIRVDIRQTVHLIHYAFNHSFESIVARGGPIGGRIGNYLDLIYPNQRQEARAKSLRLLRSLSREHNTNAPNYAMSQTDFEDLIRFVEASSLAIFELILTNFNSQWFGSDSWQEANLFLQVKALASFPESLMKTIILQSSDTAMINKVVKAKSLGMGGLNQFVFDTPVASSIWNAFTTNFSPSDSVLSSGVNSGSASPCHKRRCQ